MSRGQSQPRNQSVRRVLERCRTRSTVEIIDVDKGDVVIIDNAESSHQGSRGLRTSRRNSSPDVVINIDDEENDILRKAHADATSKEFDHASSESPASEASQNDESLISIEKEHLPFQSREPMRKVHDVGSSGNRFGLSYSSESCSSESDSTEVNSAESVGSDGSSSDCEIIEDASGNIREQWERAALKKKMVYRDRLGSEDRSCSSGSSDDAGFSSEQAAQSKLNADTTDLDTDTTTNIGDKEPELISETYPSTNRPTAETIPDNMKSGDPETVLDSSLFNLNIPLDSKIKDDGMHNGKEILTATTSRSEGPYVEFKFRERRGPYPGQSSTCKPQPRETEFFSSESAVRDENQHIPGVPTSCSSFCSSGIAGIQEKEKVAFNRSSCNNQLPVHTDMICERERHKESDEYKRAVEEEWAARQRELQIQAEEAQRLRRRRKAETLRLLDMEKRQKQRLEEIRESQKKDEETINMKDYIRAEVRKELELMELRYRDMASLLRGLGINVRGGHFPTPHEVNAAYRQALLRFHPDRASRSDIRQQVKAEETFKMISRLKDKLMPVL